MRGIMADSSASSYIHMVHHLIEECMLFNMRKEECMEALSRHARIDPVITATVWKELEKENKEFFEAYENRSTKKKCTRDDWEERIRSSVQSDCDSSSSS